MNVGILGFLLRGRRHPAAVVVEPTLALIARDHRSQRVVRRLAKAVHLAALAQFLELVLEVDRQRATFVHQLDNLLNRDVLAPVHRIRRAIQPCLALSLRLLHPVAERVGARHVERSPRDDHPSRDARLAELGENRERREL